VAEVAATTDVTTTASATQTFNFESCAVPPCLIPSGTESFSGSATASNFTTDRRSFFGAGPRVGLEGSVPLIGPLAFDYSGNAAVLFGNTKIINESNSGFSYITSGTNQMPPIVGVAGTLTNNQTGIVNRTQWQSRIVVYNLDIQAGLAYWFTPNWKLAVSYRLDAFFDVLRAFPDASNNGGQSINRFYHGPKLTLTGKID
jgi:hypothetical protein